MLGKPVVHGIYMLCYLSRQAAGSVTSASTLAKAADVPPEHARKILMRLCAAGLVTSTSGRSGGYALTKGMEDTSVLDVLDAVGAAANDCDHQERTCAAIPNEVCSFRPGFAELRKQMRRVLATRTLASIVGGACSKRARPSLAVACE